MDMKEIKEHWEGLASKYGENIQATTKTATIKKLEVNALNKWIGKMGKDKLDILEVGCGNGVNCMMLAEDFKEHNFYGVDYVDEMIESARKGIDEKGFKNIAVAVDDVLKLDSQLVQERQFDIVYTDRCIINLNTIELQKKAMLNIVKKIKKGGYYLMIENSIQCYDKQNLCRESVGLERRKPAEYNLFLDDEVILRYMEEELGMELLSIDNFASLHDIVQYVIIPMMNKGNIEYGNLLMQKVTEFELAASDFVTNKFGEFGQNRLYVLKKG